MTLLFTDAVGSTRLLLELGAERYAEVLAEHHRLIRAACARNGGIEVDSQGDGFFFAFPTAPGAVAAARELTEALADGSIHARVGLHTGRPLVTAEGYIGADVHLAARVAAAAHGGQVVLSSATAEQVASGLTELGEHRLKDITAASRSTSSGTRPSRRSRRSRTRTFRARRAPSSAGSASSRTCSPGLRTVPASSPSRGPAARARRGSRSRPPRRSFPRSRRGCSGPTSRRCGTPVS